MKILFPKQESELVIIDAKMEHLKSIMKIYETVSLNKNLKGNISKNSFEFFKEKGGIIAIPPIELIEIAIKSSEYYFKLAVLGKEVIGFVWGKIEFSKGSRFFNFFSKKGNLTDEYHSYQELDSSQVSYGADLMLHPNYQKSIYSYILYYNYMNFLHSINKEYVLFIIEHLISFSKASSIIDLDIFNTASKNLHNKFKASKIKIIHDKVLLKNHNIYIHRLSEFYIENIEFALNKTKTRLNKIGITL